MTAEDVIRALSLEPLPGEGGFFRETYRSRLQIPGADLPGYDGQRAASTAIYYLLTPETFSTMHRLRGDEVFHFYAGDPVEMLQLWPDGRTAIVVIGADIFGGVSPQVIVPAGVWQGSRLIDGGRFALLGTTMAPGYAVADSELGDRAELVRRFPERASMIVALTSEPT
jgi:predicted cupin superfamily sugar epimerase